MLPFILECPNEVYPFFHHTVSTIFNTWIIKSHAKARLLSILFLYSLSWWKFITSVIRKYFFHNIHFLKNIYQFGNSKLFTKLSFFNFFHKVREIYLFFIKILDLYLLQLKSNQKKKILFGLFIFVHLLHHVYPPTDQTNSTQKLQNIFLFYKSHIDIISMRYKT
jgi:hypothetical protein